MHNALGNGTGWAESLHRAETYEFSDQRIPSLTSLPGLRIYLTMHIGQSRHGHCVRRNAGRLPMFIRVGNSCVQEANPFVLVFSFFIHTYIHLTTHLHLRFHLLKQLFQFILIELLRRPTDSQTLFFIRFRNLRNISTTHSTAVPLPSLPTSPIDSPHGNGPVDHLC